MVYVDDLLIFARDEEALNEVVKVTEQIYEVKIMEDITFLLGVEFLKKFASILKSARVTSE